MSKASKDRMREAKHLAEEVCRVKNFPLYNREHNPYENGLIDGTKGQSARFTSHWEVFRSRVINKTSKGLLNVEKYLTELGWTYIVHKGDNPLETKVVCNFNQYFTLEYIPYENGIKVFDLLSKRKKPHTCKTLLGAIALIKKKNTLRLEKKAKKKADDKRESVYNKVTPQHLLVLLEKFNRLYKEGGISMSKAARVVGVEYKATKAYLNGEFKV